MGKTLVLMTLSIQISPGYSQGTLLEEHPKLCNKTGEPLNVSWGYSSGVSRGWFRLSDESCITPILHASHGLPTHYYAIPTDSGDNDAWSGDESKSYCIPRGEPNPSQTFELKYNNGCSADTELHQYGSLENGKILTSSR
ncbi:MAG: DUF1036 domain-containing protein [Coleofasciculus sp. S288]|nr:DUF1036 domain-containing protein [Coleofasciculus sp. S288]